jgi:hypothetical protein
MSPRTTTVFNEATPSEPDELVFRMHEDHLGDRRFFFDSCGLCMLRYPDDYDYERTPWADDADIHGSALDTNNEEGN